MFLVANRFYAKIAPTKRKHYLFSGYGNRAYFKQADVLLQVCSALFLRRYLTNRRTVLSNKPTAAKARNFLWGTRRTAISFKRFIVFFFLVEVDIGIVEFTCRKETKALDWPIKESTLHQAWASCWYGREKWANKKRAYWYLEWYLEVILTKTTFSASQKATAATDEIFNVNSVNPNILKFTAWIPAKWRPLWRLRVLLSIHVLLH